MTTPNITARTSQEPGRFRLPDRPEREPDDMTTAKHLSETGLHHALKRHLGNPETTIVSGERYIIARRGADMKYPDLLVAFDADPEAYEETNGYLLTEQGKPPDLVLEIASRATGSIDVVEKREFYQNLGIREYWRFDATGEFHGARLAGDRLAGGRYQPIEIVEIEGGTLQGYSAALDINWRWTDGHLECYNPVTGQHIATFDSLRESLIEEREARTAAEAELDAASARADAEREARQAASASADAEREARAAAEAERDAAEARVRELEERLSQQNP